MLQELGMSASLGMNKKNVEMDGKDKLKTALFVYNFSRDC